MLTERLYHQQCPNCPLTFSQFERSIQLLFTEHFGFYPRDQQIKAVGAYKIYHNNLAYIHGSLIVGFWLYEFEFRPILTYMNVPSYGRILVLDSVVDGVVSQICPAV